jgi:hypothetical protein
METIPSGIMTPVRLLKAKIPIAVTGIEFMLFGICIFLSSPLNPVMVIELFSLIISKESPGLSAKINETKKMENNIKQIFFGINTPPRLIQNTASAPAKS